MIRIYHNSRCSKSRSALALLEQHGKPFEVINYLETPPSAVELKTLLWQLGITARQLLRSGEDIYKALHLDDSSLDDAMLIDAMTKHPRLIERPIVVADDKAIIGRPPEAVLEILA
ncbi:arsenate reductase (glutaredoxin) [Dyella caseinilytica]|uniref:Arsenate reductase n=1 Tax=Dyella caseinilytica TaxID=1849581 RepID=A0ABX7GNK3_9GAMM|nr:arsenate reductase (glutaredoxin) [Dyella caseinilytica]QRN52001.1 arsenate reductase (glutaredoxin) [Dyella caseinilytica]GGA04200.1 arsenate reductase [Dyella caseinilytica]